MGYNGLQLRYRTKKPYDVSTRRRLKYNTLAIVRLFVSLMYWMRLEKKFTKDFDLFGFYTLRSHLVGVPRPGVPWADE
jgi:hypothetical protein